MRDTSCKHLRYRYQALKSDRSRVEGKWEEIENYVMPYRGEFFKKDSTETDVEWRKRWIYDSVPVESARTLAASLNGSLTTPMVKWFTLGFRMDELNSDTEARTWLEECGQRCWSALKESNFNLEVNEAYLDLVGFGNSIVVEEIAGSYEAFEGLDFKAVPIKECFFESNYRDQVKTFFRRVFMTPIQMVDRFGAENVPETIATRAESHSATTEKTECVMAIFEREAILKEVKDGTLDLSQPLPPKRRPYGVKWFTENTAEELGEEGGFFEMPAYVIRWLKVSGSQWGHGPAHVAMGDILTLNQMVAMILSSSEKVIDPPTLAEDRGIVGDLDLNAGGLTIVRKIDGIRPYESSARFDVSQLQRQDLRDSIRRMFHVDDLELKESPAMTATEVTVRYEMMQRLLGPTLGRLQADFLDPLIQRTFNVLYRAGQLPKPPEIVISNDAQMEVTYLGPLARSQKSDEVASVERLMQSLSQVSPIFPEMLDVIDPVKTARLQAELLSVPSKVLRTDEEIKEIQDKRSKDQAQAQAVAMAQQGGDAMKALGEGGQALEEGRSGIPIPGQTQAAAA